MLEAGTMLLFCAVLFASVALGWSIIPALFVGVLLFMGYGLVRRCSLRAMASRAAGSVRSAGTVVVAFVLIGVLTSLWRASGTIAFIVAHSTAVIHAATVIRRCRCWSGRRSPVRRLWAPSACRWDCRCRRTR